MEQDNKYQYDNFHAWFHETESFSPRSSRFFEVMETITTYPLTQTQTVVEWLEAAFYAGRE